MAHRIGRWLNVEEAVEAGASRLRGLWAAAGLPGNDLGWVDGDLYLDRRALRKRGITAVIARRGTGHGPGLGTLRSVVKQTR